MYSSYSTQYSKFIYEAEEHPTIIDELKLVKCDLPHIILYCESLDKVFNTQIYKGIEDKGIIKNDLDLPIHYTMLMSDEL